MKQKKFEKVVEWEKYEDLVLSVFLVLFVWVMYFTSLAFPFFLSLIIILLYTFHGDTPKRKVYWVEKKK